LVVCTREARVAAEYFELRVYGTLYVLLEAYKRNVFKSKVEVRSIVDDMLSKGFYLSTEVYARFLFLLEEVK
jgi:predicted nucleic acid-binding protein